MVNTVEQVGFNPSRYVLGRLCQKNHKWRDTDFSLRIKDRNYCVVCARESAKARAKAKRQPKKFLSGDLDIVVYGLVNPESGEVFYVGRTVCGLQERLRNHIYDAKSRCNSPRSRAIRAILAANKRPEIFEIARKVCTSKEDAIEFEQAWIDFYQAKGSLANVSPASRGCHGTPLKDYKWLTPEIKTRLGVDSDAQIARDVGVSVRVVRNARFLLDIPTAPLPWAIKWTEEMLSDLGVMFDRHVAAKYKITATMVRLKRQEMGIPLASRVKWQWTEETLALLGVIPDIQLSKKVGCCVDIVREKRLAMGIPQASVKREEKPDILAMLGTMSDRALAELAGRDRRYICGLRHEMNIPRFKSKTPN